MQWEVQIWRQADTYMWVRPKLETNPSPVFENHRTSFFGLLGFRPFFFSTIRPWLPGVEALASSRKVMICILFLAAEGETDQ